MRGRDIFFACDYENCSTSLILGRPRTQKASGTFEFTLTEIEPAGSRLT